MQYSFSYIPYSRKLASPFVNAARTYTHREGFLIKLIDDNNNPGYGELIVSPRTTHLSFDEILKQLDALPQTLDDASIDTIAPSPIRLALDAARWLSSKPTLPQKSFNVAGLLRSGQDALNDLPQLLDSGYQTLKWKVGVLPQQDEFKILDSLLNKLPSNTFLRLDANASLNLEAATPWLQKLAHPQIEFLEQPLCSGQEFFLPPSPKIALDESVDNARLLLEFSESFAGPLVVKPLCLQALHPLLSSSLNKAQLVFSSCMETGIGMQLLLALAAHFESPNALGLGTHRFFLKDSFDWHSYSPIINFKGFDYDAMEQLWKTAQQPA